ncbi:MAG: hypothetical protein LBB43_01720 [Spirochaetaceae bacterium]|jgi:hypothetical protein|nr:hypothetical protein [Spirochaetaceae bacterium]
MIQRYFCVWSFIIIFCAGFVLQAQEQEYAPLSRSFRNLSLGIGLDELKAALQQDELFLFRGDRDVSLLPFRDESLVETTGTSFVRRALFQLRDGQVFIMSFTLNTQLIDHYSVFTSLVQKYGEPAELDPKQTIWESEGTRIALERPLTIKYIDTQIFNEIRNESQTDESDFLQLREGFLNEF